MLQATKEWKMILIEGTTKDGRAGIDGIESSKKKYNNKAISKMLNIVQEFYNTEMNPNFKFDLSQTNKNGNTPYINKGTHSWKDFREDGVLLRIDRMTIARGCFELRFHIKEA